MVQKRNTDERALVLHKRWKGKVSTVTPIKDLEKELHLIYTPGVGAVSRHLTLHPEDAPLYTACGHTVAVVSDGSAVLGLGNIGPTAALPVMEGKAALFKELAGIDAVPVVLDTQDPDEIIAVVTALAPSFGGINLEDIAAPKCFTVEQALVSRLSMPVVHDDQHGTAIVVLAGLINAHKVVKKDIARSRIAIIGAGAAGVAIAKLLVRYGVGDVVVVDRAGIIASARGELSAVKWELASITNREERTGGVREALVGADVAVGVSGPGSITPTDIKLMAQQPIVFALANPTPEILPDVARAAGAAVVATGRSDFPNQVNNALVFPGLFQGAFRNGVTRITDRIKCDAAQALARLVRRPQPEHILPSIFDKRVVRAIARSVR